MRDDSLARIVIREHPELGEGPVEIETLADEALAIEKSALQVAVLDLYLPGETEPRPQRKPPFALPERVPGYDVRDIVITSRNFR